VGIPLLILSLAGILFQLGNAFQFVVALICMLSLIQCNILLFLTVEAAPCGDADAAQESKAATDSSNTALLIRAGCELGGWLFLGSSLQIYGLHLISASRAAFLVQTTTIMVPVIESVLNKRKLPTNVSNTATSTLDWPFRHHMGML
jgi:drug/metabolite transporter (DMT)-like permease